MEAVLNNSSFLEKIKSQKRDVYSELKVKLYKAKLTAVRDFLERKGVEVDYRITDLDELKQTVKDNDSIYSQVESFEKGFEKDLTDVIESLRAGSTNAFQMLGKSLKSITKTALTGMAISTAGTLLVPHAFEKATTAVALATPRAYAGVKEFLEQKKELKENAVNVTLLNLARVDIEGEPLRMELPENVRKNVAEQLKYRNIKINDENTLAFLSSITELNMKDKIRAIELINSLTGNRIDIKHEINKNKKSISEITKSVKNNVVNPLASGLYAGLHAASVINDTAGDATASAITGIGTMALSDNVALGVATGSSQYLLSKFGNMLPFVGSYVEDVTSRINSAENYLCIGSAGLAIAGVSVLGTLASKGIKGIVNKVKNKQAVKDSNETLKEDILKRIEDAKENTSEELEKRTNKQVILDIVCDELRMDDIDIPYNLQDTFELKTILQTQPLKKKMRALNVMNTLNKIEKDNNRTFKNQIKDYAKYAYYGGILTLAGLGAYDRFFNNGFLENIRIDKNTLEKKLENDTTNYNNSIEEINQEIENKNTKSAAQKNYKDFDVSPETFKWKEDYGIKILDDLRNFIEKLASKVPTYERVESVKNRDEIIGDYLSKIIPFFKWKEINWSKIQLPAEVEEELAKFGKDPTVEGLQEFIAETPLPEALIVKCNADVFPPELVALAYKTNGNFTEKDLAPFFPKVDINAIDENAAIPFIPQRGSLSKNRELLEKILNNPNIEEIDQIYGTQIAPKVVAALKLSETIEAEEATKEFLESVKYADQIKSPYKVFGVGAVAGTIANGIKSLFTRKSKKVPELPEAKAGENNEKEKFENSIKVDLNDSQVVDDSNIQEAKDEVEEKGKGKDEEK